MRKLSGRWVFAIGLMILCCSLGFAVPALAEGSIEYMGFYGLTTCDSYTDMSALLSGDYPHVSGDELLLPGGSFYAVTEDTTIDRRVQIGSTGTVYLILCDNTTLTLSSGIHLTGYNELIIFDQAGHSGSLVATAGGMSDMTWPLIPA